MPEVLPFRGLHYVPERAKAGFDDLITPPFDVISPEQRAELARRSAHNMVHLILPESQGTLNPYQSAALLLDEWIASGAMAPDTQPSFYVLEQRFTDRFGCDRTRHAFYGIAKIPETGEKTVLGHERTFRHKIQDRLELMRATEANFGAIFVMYEDPARELAPFLRRAEADPDIAARTIDGVEQRMWRAGNDSAVGEFFRNRTLYIADGHHRFATAVAYRDEMRERGPSETLQPWDYVLMGFVALEDPGLEVYPAHRLFDPPEALTVDDFKRRLEPWFDIHETRNGFLSELAEGASGTLGLAFASGEKMILRLKPIDRAKFLGDDHGPSWRDLDVAILHRGILENVLGLPAGGELRYEPDAEKALAACARGEKQALCLLNPTTPQQIRACADAGEFMPQKATYLFPKLPTGGVIYRHR